MRDGPKVQRRAGGETTHKTARRSGCTPRPRSVPHGTRNKPAEAPLRSWAPPRVPPGCCPPGPPAVPTGQSSAGAAHRTPAAHRPRPCDALAKGPRAKSPAVPDPCQLDGGGGNPSTANTTINLLPLGQGVNLGEAGFQLGGGGSIEPPGSTPHPKGAQLTGPPKILPRLTPGPRR